MTISTGQKIGVVSCAVGAVVVIVVGIFAWNHGPRPKEEAEVEVASTTPAAASESIATRPAGAPLFTLSPTTTAITTPLHSDGTPDYVAAINAYYRKDATPENNALTAWLAVTGTGRLVLSTKTADAFIAALGAKRSDAQWKSFYTYCDEQGHSEEGSTAKVDDEQKAEMRPWTENDLPLLAAFLKEYAGEIDAAKAAWSRPRYWMPAISSDGRSVIGVTLPTLGFGRDFAKTLAARAMQRAGSHDFDGFVSDLFVVRHMAALLCSGSTVIEHLVGYAVDAEATRALAGAVASGIFSGEECLRLADKLDALSPLEDLTGSLATAERWSSLDATLLVAMRHAETLKDVFPDEDSSVLESINVDLVDWDSVLKMFNSLDDQWIAAFQKPRLVDMQKAGKVLSRVTTRKSEAGAEDLSPVGGETREEYTQRVATFLVKRLGSGLSKAEEIRRRTVMLSAMARTLVAAAQHRARTGTWPQSLAEFIPSEEKSAAVDMYSADGTDPVQYELTASGPRLYSVGKNHIAAGAPNPTTDAP